VIFWVQGDDVRHHKSLQREMEQQSKDGGNIS